MLVEKLPEPLRDLPYTPEYDLVHAGVETLDQVMALEVFRDWQDSIHVDFRGLCPPQQRVS